MALERYQPPNKPAKTPPKDEEQKATRTIQGQYEDDVLKHRLQNEADLEHIRLEMEFQRQRRAFTEREAFTKEVIADAKELAAQNLSYKALKVLSDAYQLDRSNTVLSDELIRQTTAAGKALFTDRLYLECIDTLEQLHAVGLGSESSQYELARAFDVTQQYPKAIEAARAALQYQAHHPHSHALIAQANILIAKADTDVFWSRARASGEYVERRKKVALRCAEAVKHNDLARRFAPKTMLDWVARIDVLIEKYGH